MDAAQFRLPVRLLPDGEAIIVEVYSASEALEFLLAWPKPGGAVYQGAANACLAASVDIDSTDEAQEAFRRFARLSGILAKDMMPAPRRGRLPQSAGR